MPNHRSSTALVNHESWYKSASDESRLLSNGASLKEIRLQSRNKSPALWMNEAERCYSENYDPNEITKIHRRNYVNRRWILMRLFKSLGLSCVLWMLLIFPSFHSRNLKKNIRGISRRKSKRFGKQKVKSWNEYFSRIFDASFLYKFFLS